MTRWGLVEVYLFDAYIVATAVMRTRRHCASFEGGSTPIVRRYGGGTHRPDCHQIIEKSQYKYLLATR